MIYLDNNSTTQLDMRVFEAMQPYFIEYYGNASSSHELGAISFNAVRESREKIAELIEANESEIFFTSGATESINLCLKGIVAGRKEPHIVTCETEHPALLETCRFLEGQGVKVTYLPVAQDGLIDLVQLKDAIQSTTVLVAIMMVNNETGVIQPIKEIAEITHLKNVLFMTDATQAFGKLSISVKHLGIDILCFSGHKFYGPKGIGGIYLRSRRPFKVKLTPLINGGGQEKGLRSGTLNVPSLVGLGKAAELAKVEMVKDEFYIKGLRDHLETSLLKLPSTFINGNQTRRIYNTSNICFNGADADAIIVALKNIAVSNGSACSSTSVEPSHVLKAMGRTDTEAFSSLRFSLGKFNKQTDIETTIKKVSEVVRQLREYTI